MESLAEVLGISVAELLGVADEPKDNIIKNITEISKEEKERDIWYEKKSNADDRNSNGILGSRYCLGLELWFDCIADRNTVV